MRRLFAILSLLFAAVFWKVTARADSIVSCSGDPVDPLTVAAIVDLFGGDFVELRDGNCSVGRCRETDIQIFIGSSTNPLGTAASDLERLRQALNRHLSPEIDLASEMSYPTARGLVIEYPQLVRGQAVRGASIVVSLDGLHRVVGVVNSITTMPDDLPPIPKMTPDQIVSRLNAVESFARPAGVYGSLTPPAALSIDPVPFLFSGPNGIEWAYEVRIQRDETRGPNCTGVPAPAVDHVVSGNDAATLRIKERSHQCRPTARVFDPSPFRSTCPGKVPEPEPDDFVQVELQRLRAVGENRYLLEGRYVKIEELRLPHHDAVIVEPGADCRFAVQNGTVAFAAVMAYYHLDEKQAYVDRLGIAEAVNNELVVDVTAGCFDSARYENVPKGDGPLWFGEFEPFMAEDGMVVIHEHGHSVQAAQAIEQYDGCTEPQAMSEGFADYWAFSHFAEKLSGSCQTCFAPWAHHGACKRRLDRSAPRDIPPKGNRYDDGLLWTNALLDVCESIRNPMLSARGNREVCDSIILYGHYAVGRLGRPPSMYVGAAAILTADLTLNRGANLPAICEAFVKNRMLSELECARINKLDVLVRPPTRPRPVRRR